LREPIINWLGRQFWNQTCNDEVEVKIDQICELLDMDEDFGEVE
jgi:hypothetical protein